MQFPKGLMPLSPGYNLAFGAPMLDRPQSECKRKNVGVGNSLHFRIRDAVAPSYDLVVPVRSAFSSWAQRSTTTYSPPDYIGPMTLGLSSITVNHVVHFFERLFFNPKYFWTLATLVIVGDVVLTQFIIRFVQCMNDVTTCNAVSH